MDIPYSTKHSYDQYPCIRTIGGKCIFMAQMDNRSPRFGDKIPNKQKLVVKWEFIDLRTSQKNGRNRLKDIVISEHEVVKDRYSLFLNGINWKDGDFLTFVLFLCCMSAVL